MHTFVRHLDAPGTGLGLQRGLDSGVHVDYVVAGLKDGLLGWGQTNRASRLQVGGQDGQEDEEEGDGGDGHHSFGRGREREGQERFLVDCW